MRWWLASIVLVGCTSDQFVSPDASGDATPSEAAPSEAASDVGVVEASAPCQLSQPFGAGVSVSTLDTTFDDDALRLAANGLSGLFQSNRGALDNIDIYATSRATLADAFGNVALVASLSSAMQDTDPTLSNDGLTVFFASNRVTGSNGGWDIFTATRASVTAAFSTPSTVKNVSTSDDETQPYLVNDTDLYFSGRLKGAATYDIYHSTLVSSTWTSPIQVPGVSVNSADDDEPVVTPDGLTMYFASARNSAQMDIFVAKRATTSQAFGTPVPVAELNTTFDDRPSWISADGCRLVFFSNRTGGSGGFDLYVANKP